MREDDRTGRYRGSAAGSGRSRSSGRSAATGCGRGSGRRRPRAMRFRSVPLDGDAAARHAGAQTGGCRCIPLSAWPRSCGSSATPPPCRCLGTHVSTHRCWPWDLDPWVELNNGRTLTLYDLGRMPLSVAHRAACGAGARKGWGLTVAGNTTRYRRRVRLFDRVDDAQPLHRLGCAVPLYRAVDVEGRGMHLPYADPRRPSPRRDGIVPPAEVLAALGQPTAKPGPARLGAGLDRGRCPAALAARRARACACAAAGFPRFIAADAAGGRRMTASEAADLGLVLLRLGQPALQHAAADLHLRALFRRDRAWLLHGRGLDAEAAKAAAQAYWGWGHRVGIADRACWRRFWGRLPTAPGGG